MDYNKRPLWQLIIIYLLIGGILYAAVYYLFFSKKSYTPVNPAATVTPATSPTATPTPLISQAAGQRTITVTSSGFDPKDITIKKGNTVTWTNQSGKNIFIASNPHPTHTDYAPLNLGVVKDGDSISLTFPTAGTYKYHNHLVPSQTGSITVQ